MGNFMKTTNWGIIGPGKIARDFANDLVWLDTPQQIVSILGNSPDNTEQFARDYNVAKYFTTPKDFFRQKEIDVAYVASPHTHHFEHTLTCLENRIPVLCEKPMTINADQCRQLIEASRKYNTFLMEGMWIRFLPGIQQVLAMINEGWIGDLVSIRASMGYKAPYDPDSRYFDPAQGGGSLLDLGIYPVFLALLLLGRPQTIKAIGKLSEEGVDETCSILFHYRNGQHAVLESSLVSETDLPAEISGEKGTIKILNPWYEKSSGIELSLYGEGKIVYPCSWNGHGLQFEMAEVLRCIRSNKIESEILSHDFSLAMIEVMDEIRNQINVVYEMYE